MPRLYKKKIIERELWINFARSGVFKAGHILILKEFL